MTEDTLEIFTEIKTKITVWNKDEFIPFINKIRRILTENEINDYFEKLSLLGIATQLAQITKHYKLDWFKKELCELIATEGKNYFKKDMNNWIDMAETGLSSSGNNIAWLDDIDFTSTFFNEFTSATYPPLTQKQIIFNLRSIANGRFSQDNLSVCFALYFIILRVYYDFPDDDITTIINLLNYFILITEKERHNRFNMELERCFANYIELDFSERRFFYTDLPFIYKTIEEKEKQSAGEITIKAENKSFTTKIKTGIFSQLQTISRSLEILLSFDKAFNPCRQNEIRFDLFERVFFNNRKIEEVKSTKEEKIILMKSTPYGLVPIPENKKLHHESALSLFKKTISEFKIFGEEDQQEIGKNNIGQKNIYQNSLNLEYGVVICLYMLLKEMSFDDVKEIFEDTKEAAKTDLMQKLLTQNDSELEIKTELKHNAEKITLLEQMLFFMAWEICGYENSKSKDLQHYFQTVLKNKNVINESALNFESCFHPLMEFKQPEIFQIIQQKHLTIRQAVEYRDPFWWKRQLVYLLNWKAVKNFLNSSNNKRVFTDDAFSISSLQDRSLIIELLFRFSRTEPEFKENIIAMLNHLREVQKDFFPVYYDSNTKCYNDDAIKNQETIRSIDEGFWIPAIYQSLYPFNTQEFIKKYGEEQYFCRNIIECRLFQESEDVLYIKDKNKIKKNYRETNKKAMYTRYLYLDRNNYVHNGSSRSIEELLKPIRIKDLLITLADILLYLDTDKERYSSDKTKSVIANDKLISPQYEACTESIRKECKCLAALIMKIQGFEPDEITRSVIEDFAKGLKPNERFDYNCELSKNEFLKERINRLLNIIFLTYEPDFNSHSIDFLIEHKMPVLLSIVSVTFKLVKAIENKQQ